MLRLSGTRTNFTEEIEFCKCIGDALGHLMQFVNKTWTQGQFSQIHSKEHKHRRRHGALVGRKLHCERTAGIANTRLCTACFALALLLALTGRSVLRSWRLTGEGNWELGVKFTARKTEKTLKRKNSGTSKNTREAMFTLPFANAFQSITLKNGCILIAAAPSWP